MKNINAIEEPQDRTPLSVVPQSKVPGVISRVVLCFRAPLGGLFRHVCDLTRELLELGIEVGMVFDSTTGSQKFETVKPQLEQLCSLGLLQIPMSRNPSLGDIVNVKKLERFVRDARADLIHGHGAKGGFYARLVGRRLGIPAFYTPHGGSLHYSPKKLLGQMFLMAERRMLSNSSGVIFESDFARNEFCKNIGVPACPTTTIHNGLSREDFNPKSGSSSYDFVFVGELRKLKGIDVLLDAAARIQARRIDFRLGVFGAGPEQAKFRARAAALDLDSAVEWEGEVASGRYALEKGECLILPSRRESLPYILLEAAAMGMPLIATDVGGVAEIVGKDNKNDLVKPGDPEALSNRMVEYLTNRENAQLRANGIRQMLARGFCTEEMVEQTLGFYISSVDHSRKANQAIMR